MQFPVSSRKKNKQESVLAESKSTGYKVNVPSLDPLLHPHVLEKYLFTKGRESDCLLETVAQRDHWHSQPQANKMCYHTVEKYGCGHEDKALIPCEDVFETGKCKKPEEDQIHEKSEPQCKKCKEDGEEEAHLLAQLEKFAMEESLKPSAAPRIRKTNARTMYFKRCIVWNRCKRKCNL